MNIIAAWIIFFGLLVLGKSIEKAVEIIAGKL
jgi:hypothetical protein